METATALFITDLEIGTSEHDDGLGWREAEAWRVARAIAEHVKEHAERIAVVVFPGDTLHSRKPAPWSYKVFQWLIVELRKDTQVRIFQGNHDSDPQGGVGPLSTGFLTDDGHARGRPVGLAMDGHGALLIADDAGGAVWRVTASGSQTRAEPAPIVR